MEKILGLALGFVLGFGNAAWAQETLSPEEYVDHTPYAPVEGCEFKEDYATVLLREHNTGIVPEDHYKKLEEIDPKPIELTVPGLLNAREQEQKIYNRARKALCYYAKKNKALTEQMTAKKISREQWLQDLETEKKRVDTILRALHKEEAEVLVSIEDAARASGTDYKIGGIAELHYLLGIKDKNILKMKSKLHQHKLKENKKLTEEEYNWFTKLSDQELNARRRNALNGLYDPKNYEGNEREATSKDEITYQETVDKFAGATELRKRRDGGGSNELTVRNQTSQRNPGDADGDKDQLGKQNVNVPVQITLTDDGKGKSSVCRATDLLQQAVDAFKNNDGKSVYINIKSNDPELIKRLPMIEEGGSREAYENAFKTASSDCEKENQLAAQGKNAKGCDQMKAELVHLLMSDPKNSKILSEMSQVAAMKMAFRILSERGPTKVEDVAAKKGIWNTLENYVNSLSSSKDYKSFEEDLVKFYGKHGRKADVDKVTASLGSGSLVYGSPRLRMDNESSSALLLYLSKEDAAANMDSALAFTEADAAAVWAQQRFIDLNKDKKGFGIGQEQRNLLNFPTQVYSLLHMDFHGKPLEQLDNKLAYGDKDKLLTDLKTREAGITKRIQDVYASQLATFKTKYPGCFVDKNGKPCEVPPVLDESKVSEIKRAIAAMASWGDLGDVADGYSVDYDATKVKNGVIELSVKKGQ